MCARARPYAIVSKKSEWEEPHRSTAAAQPQHHRSSSTNRHSNMAEKAKPRGSRLSPFQEDMKFLRMIDQEDRTIQRIRESPDGKHHPTRGLEFQERERARPTPFATHEEIPAGRFNRQNMGNKKNKLRLRLGTAASSRPQTGSSMASARSTSSMSSRSSRSSRLTSRTLRSTGASSLYSLDSSASNLTQVAMERIDRLERELEEQRRQREEAQREMQILRKIVEENSARTTTE